MSKQQKRNEESFWIKLATFVVDKRNLFFLMTLIALVFSFFSRNWVEVENDLAAFLPDSSETRQALDIMDEQFITYGTARVMVSNITEEEGQSLADILSGLKGVQNVDYDNSRDHYINASALFDVTFSYGEEDERCLTALDLVKETLQGYDASFSTDLGTTLQDTIASEVQVIMIYVAVIVVVVLLFTSQTYGEVPVLLMTFVIAMMCNAGSNFVLKKISFVSNSVTSILQLALSLDYAIILVNRFKEEHETKPIREAAIVALSKAIPEIGASSLTTIGGLFAMIFMQFKIGPDMAICLIKAILFALLTVFIVMPGLLVLFGPLIDKTRHKNFVPKIPFVGRYAWATRHIVPIVFVLVAAAGLYFSNRCPYVYGYSSLTTPKLNDTQLQEQAIDTNFPDRTMVALVVPSGDYENEKAILHTLEQRSEVDEVMGLGNIEAMDGYMLADKLTPRQFSELAGLDYEAAQLIYSAYAAKQEDYGKLLGRIATYEIPLVDIFLFVWDQVDSGMVSLEQEQIDSLQEAAAQIQRAKNQLSGTRYSRMLLYLTLPESGQPTFDFIDEVRAMAQSYYPDGTVLVAGQSTQEYDFQKTFSQDNTVVSIVSILVVLVVLLFTFKSVGMPLLLILVIQGSIWINFSFPYLIQKNLFFMSYLVVSSIQMGANIDYAIVIASRYQEVKSRMSHKDAIIETLNFAFPTILTSGLILAVSGILIGQMTSECTIAGIGQCLGRGTILSMFLVLFVLPQILLLGGDLVDRTSFSVKHTLPRIDTSGRVFVDGSVRGQVNGTINGIFKGSMDGDVSLLVVSGAGSTEEEQTSPSFPEKKDENEQTKETEENA